MRATCETCYFYDSCLYKAGRCSDYTSYLPEDDYDDRVIEFEIDRGRHEYYEAYLEYLDVDTDVNIYYF